MSSRGDLTNTRLQTSREPIVAAVISTQSSWSRAISGMPQGWQGRVSLIDRGFFRWRCRTHSTGCRSKRQEEKRAVFDISIAGAITCRISVELAQRQTVRSMQKTKSKIIPIFVSILFRVKRSDRFFFIAKTHITRRRKMLDLFFSPDVIWLSHEKNQKKKSL